MPKVTVTYRAPKGDSKVVEIWGNTFYDGKPEEVELSDDILALAKNNRFFEIGGHAEAHAPKRKET